MENKRKVKVLAIDDLQENLKVLGSILVKNGYDISLATNGQQGIESAKKYQPDIILLDVMMPEMDGYETCKLMKQDSLIAHIPVIFLTAKTEMEATLKGFEVGAVDYLNKPFNSLELLSRVNVHASLKIARDEIVAQKNELEQLNNTKTKLFSIISHDLKSPINAIFGFMDLMDMNVLDQADIIKYFTVLKSNVGNTSELLNNLLSWSASQINGHNVILKEFDIKQFIEEKVSKLKIYTKQKNIQLLCTISYTKPVVSDENALKMIVRNLIKNSIKFTPEEGKIEVKVEENSSKNRLEISVIDTGVGISKNGIDKIMKTGFFSTNGTNGETGTGLGLMLCREFIAKLNGTFEIESELNKGTTMRVCLPL